MDIFAHFLWIYILFYKYKYLNWALLFAILPDLLSWGIYSVYALASKTQHFGKPHLAQIPRWVHTLYGITHSIFIFILVFVAVWISIKELPIFLLPWIIHILIDIPTHSRNFLPTPFLWPFSSWQFPGISWGSRWFMIANYTLIIICLTLTIGYGENILVTIKNFIKSLIKS